MQINLPNDSNFYFILVIVALLIISRVLRFRAMASSYTHIDRSRVGVNGSAECPRCGEVFPLGFFMIRVSLGPVFARCPSCGFFGMVRRVSPEELSQMTFDTPSPRATPEQAAEDEEERKKKRIDDSKYSE